MMSVTNCELLVTVETNYKIPRGIYYKGNFMFGISLFRFHYVEMPGSLALCTFSIRFDHHVGRLRHCNLITQTTNAMRSFIFLLSSLLISAVQCTTITGQLRLPDDTPVNRTRITLSDFTTYSQLDGTFTFYQIPEGVHLLDVHSHDYSFGQVKLQIKQGEKPKCIEYAYPGAPKQVITSSPLILKAYAKFEYFEKRRGFSVTTIFRNPMLLMMLVSVGLMFLMPKMMEGLEPEERERMQKQMQNQGDPSKMLSSMWNDLQGTPEEPAPKTKKSSGKK